MGKILSIPHKLNFIHNTLGCYGLKKHLNLRPFSLFMSPIRSYRITVQNDNPISVRIFTTSLLSDCQK